MDMNSFRPDSHVAQQSRRDKLRIQQCSNSIQHLEGFSHNLEQSTVNPGIIQVRDVQNANLLFDPSVVSSGIISFSNNSNILSAPRLTMLHQEIGAVQPNNRPIMVEGDMCTNLSNPISPRLNASSRTAGDLQGCGNSWKSLGTQPNADWMVNYSAAVGRDSNQTPTSSKYLKPSYRAYQDVQSNLTNLCGEMSDQYRQKRYEEMHYAPPLYQDVTLASIGSNGLQMTSLVHQNTGEIGHGMWTDSGNELALLPNCGNPSSAIHYDNNPMWSNKPDNTCHHWSTEAGFTTMKGETEMRDVTNDGTTQGLSLSLSSNPPSKMDVAQFREGNEFQNLHSRTDVSKEQENSRILKSGNPVPIPQPSIIGRGGGKSLQELVGTSSHNNYRSTGPLGPFTGYATILRSSRFLKPAQELLEEFCGIRGAKLVDACAVSERVSEDHVSASASAVGNAVDVTDREAGARDNSTSGVSSSTFYSSNQIGCDGGVGSSSTESYRPEYQQKKAKLLHLQEEVCRRYKLYQQQMHMVLSAFEPVVGLSAAAPYVSLAVKTISKNFRCLKIAISNQLKHVTKDLGEALLSSATGTSACRVDVDTSRLNYVDQSFEKHKSAGANLGFFEPQQPAWRPQRGLPERAVAVLRAWLFEHFLHPYPTDTDKHMLATQTGLSRNQVSNWFINARVRVWKPMVEEIYMLETDQKSKKSDGRPDNENGNISNNNNNDQPTNRLKGISAMSDEQPDYSSIGGFSLGTQDGLIAERWNQEKRSKGDCQATTSVDRSLMSFIPYHRSGLEVGGLGAVSLTLGLRHGVEHSQQHQQQQQEDHVRQQLGGQMIHDFVG